LLANCREYEFPTVAIVKDDRERIFGFYAPKGIRETSGWGKEGFDRDATDTFLFQLRPQVRVRRWTGRERARSFFRVAKDGVSLGGQTDMPRLKISSNLTEIQSLALDSTFDANQLLSTAEDEDPEILHAQALEIEVWGVGGSHAWDEYLRRKSELEEIRDERKRVDKRALVETAFDKEMFFSKTFGKASEEAP
jgi:hypothetical protein